MADEDALDRLAAARQDELEAMLHLSDSRVVARFILNVQDARDEGHEMVCVYCGKGLDDPTVTHEWYCPCCPDSPGDIEANR